MGWSPRRLLERFRAEIGLGPQQAARVARFDAARRRLAAEVVAEAAGGTRADLALVAADCGYADQAHMTREWCVHAGLPPKRWVTAEHHLLSTGPADRFKTIRAPTGDDGCHDRT